MAPHDGVAGGTGAQHLRGRGAEHPPDLHRSDGLSRRRSAKDRPGRAVHNARHQPDGGAGSPIAVQQAGDDGGAPKQRWQEGFQIAAVPG